MFAYDVRATATAACACRTRPNTPKFSNIARPSENWTAERIKRMFGTGEQDIQLPAPIWVLLTYQNAFVDDAGKLQIRRDIYNIDSRTLAAIKTERRHRAAAGAQARGGVVATNQRRPLHSRAPFHSSRRFSASAVRRKEGPYRRAASRADSSSLRYGCLRRGVVALR